MKIFQICFIMILGLVIFGFSVPVAEGILFNPEGSVSPGGVHITIDHEKERISPGETAVFNITVVNNAVIPVLVTASAFSPEQWNIQLEPSHLTVKADNERHIHLYVKAPEKAGNGSFSEVIITYAASMPSTGESLKLPTTKVKTVVEEEDSETNMMGAAIIAGTGLGIAALLSTEKGKLALSTLFSPLYTRINRSNILENEIRKDLFNYIRDNPGESFSDIKRKLNLQNGMLVHHLKTLERARFIRSKKEGGYRRFFLKGQKIPEYNLNESQNKIINYLRSNQGAPQSVIAMKLGFSRQTVNYHILALENAGLVEIVRKGRRTSCRTSDSFQEET